jgi:plastocyanin
MRITFRFALLIFALEAAALGYSYSSQYRNENTSIGKTAPAALLSSGNKPKSRHSEIPSVPSSNTCATCRKLVGRTSTNAKDDLEMSIRIKNHQFQPTELRIPVGTRVKITIRNEDPTPEEFESSDLRRAVAVSGNSIGNLWLGPLPKGEYGFYGDFHQKTAQGKLIVN